MLMHRKRRISKVNECFQDECMVGRSDPYEFDATREENGTGVDGIKRQRDDPKPSSLFTSEGLQASYKDLDQIFDNSDPDTSSDETVSLASKTVISSIQIFRWHSSTLSFRSL